MADNLKIPIVLDFFGLPGCGKSTVSHLLAERLRNAGYKVYEPSYDLDHNLWAWKRKLKKLYQYIVYMVLNPKKVSEIVILVKHNGYTVFFEQLSQCINIVTKYYAIYVSGFDYIIFDEGFYQAAISLSLVNNKVLSFDNLQKMLEMINSDIRIYGIYMHVSQEIALKRMAKRGGRDSRIDAHSNENDKLNLLENFNKNCVKLSTTATYRIDASHNIEEVFIKLFNQINE